MPVESQIESKCRDYAILMGCLTYKFTSPARRNVPDRIFILPGGAVFFVEFKRKGKLPTPAQKREANRLRAHGCTVFAINDVNSFKDMLDEFNSGKLPGGGKRLHT